MKEDSQRFVASSSKEPALGRLVIIELVRGEGKTQKKLGDFICIRQKLKSSEFYTRRYEFWSASPARLWNSCERNLSLYHRISKAGWYLYLSAVQGFAPSSSHKKKKGFEISRFYRLSATDGKNGKGNNSRGSLEKSGLPNSLSLTRNQDKHLWPCLIRWQMDWSLWLWAWSDWASIVWVRKGEANAGVDQKNRKELLLPSLCFV